MFKDKIASMKDIQKEIADEVGLTTRQVDSVIRSKNFPAVIEKYLPVDSVIQRHEELMSQSDDLKVAADMVKLGYQVHRVNKEEDKKQSFTQFLQQINNYETSRPDMEVAEPLQDKVEGREDHQVQTEQSTDAVFEETDGEGHRAEIKTNGDFDVDTPHAA